MKETIGGKIGLAVLMISVMLLVVDEYLRYKKNVSLYEFITDKRLLIRYPCYYTIVFIILLSLNIGKQEFIYAQF